MTKGASNSFAKNLVADLTGGAIMAKVIKGREGGGKGNLKDIYSEIFKAKDSSKGTKDYLSNLLKQKTTQDLCRCFTKKYFDRHTELTYKRMHKFDYLRNNVGKLVNSPQWDLIEQRIFYVQVLERLIHYSGKRGMD